MVQQSYLLSWCCELYIQLSRRCKYFIFFPFNTDKRLILFIFSINLTLDLFALSRFAAVIWTNFSPVWSMKVFSSVQFYKNHKSSQTSHTWLLTTRITEAFYICWKGLRTDLCPRVLVLCVNLCFLTSSWRRSRTGRRLASASLSTSAFSITWQTRDIFFFHWIISVTLWAKQEPNPVSSLHSCCD